MTENWWTEPLHGEQELGEALYSEHERCRRRVKYWISVYHYAALDGYEDYTALYREASMHEGESHDAGFESLVCIKSDINRAFALCTERQREAITRCLREGQLQEEAALEMGVRQPSVNGLIARGVDVIAEILSGGVL